MRMTANPPPPRGVAMALSTMMTLLTVPVIVWARAGTTLTGRDIWAAIRCPVMAGAVAATVSLAVSLGLSAMTSTLAHVAVGSILIYAVYFFVLLIPLKQADLYRDLVKHVLRRST